MPHTFGRLSTDKTLSLDVALLPRLQTNVSGSTLGTPAVSQSAACIHHRGRVIFPNAGPEKVEKKCPAGEDPNSPPQLEGGVFLKKPVR